MDDYPHFDRASKSRVSSIWPTGHRRLNELVPLRRRANCGGLGHRGILALPERRNQRLENGTAVVRGPSPICPISPVPGHSEFRAEKFSRLVKWPKETAFL